MTKKLQSDIDRIEQKRLHALHLLADAEEWYANADELYDDSGTNISHLFNSWQWAFDLIGSQIPIVKEQELEILIADLMAFSEQACVAKLNS